MNFTGEEIRSRVGRFGNCRYRSTSMGTSSNDVRPKHFKSKRALILGSIDLG
jgi:hypothetical protein